jgi:hypothetical protein
MEIAHKGGYRVAVIHDRLSPRSAHRLAGTGVRVRDSREIPVLGTPVAQDVQRHARPFGSCGSRGSKSMPATTGRTARKRAAVRRGPRPCSSGPVPLPVRLRGPAQMPSARRCSARHLISRRHVRRVSTDHRRSATSAVEG